MLVQETHIAKIKDAFEKMQSRHEFLELLNYTKPLVYGEKCVPFELRQVTYYIQKTTAVNSQDKNDLSSFTSLTVEFFSRPSKIYGVKTERKSPINRYHSFAVKKKSGSTRTIHAPVKGLKAIQKTLAFILQCVFEPHLSAMGFVKGKSIVDNARVHERSRYVFNVDLKDFFPSIDQARIWKCFQLKPFNLNDLKLRSKNDSLIKLNTGTRQFTTDHGEEIFYKLSDNEIVLFPDRNGEYERYKRRLTVDVIRPKIQGLRIIEAMKILRPYYEQIKLLVFEDARRYVYSTENINQIKKVTFSRLDLCNMISSLCCTEMEVERKNRTGEWELVTRNALPQGAPTSPVITNIVCQRLDSLLSGVARRFGLKYSRYADDITFSSMHNVYQAESVFLKELHRIIADQGFHIKEGKTRLQKDGYRKEVTGLLVNEKANVQQRYIKQLRMWLYYWEAYGYERAYGFFLQQYLVDKGHVVKGKPDMANVIAGKLEYLKMVKGADNELYLKLKERFDKLTGNDKLKEELPKGKVNLNAARPMSGLERLRFLIQENANKANVTDNTKEDLTIGEESDTVDFNSAKSSSALKRHEEDVSKIVIEKATGLMIHAPIKTVELLKFFTANDKDLKYSTHSWEEGKYEGYDDYIGKIKTEWESTYDSNTEGKYNEILRSQSERLHAKVSSFLFNKKLGHKNEKGYYNVWGEKRLKFGWSSPELKIHMSEQGNSPFSCPIPNHIRELDKKHNFIYFKEYADVFKNEIEFREDSNNFKKMILELWESELSYDFNIQGVRDLIGFSFFTDVDYVKGSIRILFSDLFKTKPEFNQIIIEKISNFENGGYHLIKITQKDSFVTRGINDPKFTNPTGNLHSIIKNLRNLADYSIVSKFADSKNYRINYLSSTENKFIQELEIGQEVLGFTHEFKFYL